MYQSSHVYQDCTNSVPIVKNKQQKMTIGVPIVTCLHRVRRIHKVCVRRLRPPNTQSLTIDVIVDADYIIALCAAIYHRRFSVIKTLADSG